VRLRDQQAGGCHRKAGRVAIDPPMPARKPKLAHTRVPLPNLSTLVRNPQRQSPTDGKEVPAEDMTRKLAWTQDRLWFDRVTIAEALPSSNRYNRRQLFIDDPANQLHNIAVRSIHWMWNNFLSPCADGIAPRPHKRAPTFSAEVILHVPDREQKNTNLPAADLHTCPSAFAHSASLLYIVQQSRPPLSRFPCHFLSANRRNGGCQSSRLDLPRPRTDLDSRIDRFRRAWQLVCHQSDVPKSGDSSLIRVHGRVGHRRAWRDGGSEAFTTHSGTCAARFVLTIPRDNLRPLSITCPYHSWTYSTDGRLVAITAEGRRSKAWSSAATVPPRPVEQQSTWLFVVLFEPGRRRSGKWRTVFPMSSNPQRIG